MLLILIDFKHLELKLQTIKGITEAFVIGDKFIGQGSVTLNKEDIPFEYNLRFQCLFDSSIQGILFLNLISRFIEKRNIARHIDKTAPIPVPTIHIIDLEGLNLY